MSWSRLSRIALITLVGSSLTLINGLAQQRQLTAQTIAAPRDERLETLEQPKHDKSDPAAAQLNSESAASADEETRRADQPVDEAELSSRKPTPIPEALFLPSAGRLSPLESAYLDAFSILREDNTCSRFYGGPQVIEVLNELKKQLTTTNLSNTIAVRMSGPTMSVTSLKYGISYRLFEKAELNLRGSFYHANTFRYEQSVPAVGGFAPNSREARVTILLHELGHLIAKSHLAWLLPNDGGDELLSHKNTEQIIAVCGQQIKQLSGASFESELRAARPSTTDVTVHANVSR